MRRDARATILVSACIGAVLYAPCGTAGQTLSENDRSEVIDSLMAGLDRAYVFPETARKMADDLRSRRASGAYAAVTDPTAFATRLTADLQAISHDLHLRVRPSGPSGGGGRSGPAAVPRSPFGRVERLDGNVAYIEITTFAQLPNQVRDAVRDVMSDAADASALILDVRRNGGGRPELVAQISSYLFGDEPVHLNSLYWRPTDTMQDFYTDPAVPGRRFGPDKPVWVLTSSRTFSAAEEFTYNLQSRKRATIVGETTGGGAHPGGVTPLPHGLNVFIPSGRAINPVTKTNWEGTGITPDVKVPADSALDEAIRRARAKA